MSAIKLAARYAKSLIDLAQERKILDEVYAEVKFLQEVIAENRDFELMLKSPIIHADKKAHIIQAVLAGRISEIIGSFLDILVRKGREAYLGDIAKSFVEQYNRLNKITPVKITTATEVNPAVIDSLLKKLKKDAHLETMQVITNVDEALIGGYVLQYEDKLLDASVQRSIKLLKKDFTNNKFVKKI